MPMHRRARLGLSYLPQEASIFRRLTVADNVRRCSSCTRMIPTRSATGSMTCCATCTSPDCATTPRSACRAASGGAWRSPARSRRNPRFILLDEPFAGVDPIAVLDIQKSSDFLKERRIGVVITDHNVRETLGICDRAYIINDGSVLAYGKPEEIVYNESVRKVYLGEHFRL
jgi:lipopolysaccharide export system ATP-binding protein